MFDMQKNIEGLRKGIPIAVAKLTTNPERNIGMIKVPLAGFCEGFLCFLRGNEIVFILF